MKVLCVGFVGTTLHAVSRGGFDACRNSNAPDCESKNGMTETILFACTIVFSRWLHSFRAGYMGRGPNSFSVAAQSFRGAVLRANCGRIAAQRMLHELSWELTATVLKSIGC